MPPDGYGPTPIPSIIDERVQEFLGTLPPIASTDAYTNVIHQLSSRIGYLLCAFAERMAAYSVRTGNSKYIEEAIKALNIASALIYWKDCVLILNLLYSSCQKIGADFNKLFISMPFGSTEFKKNVEGFGSRNERERSLEVLGYIESLDEGGFRYKRTW